MIGARHEIARLQSDFYRDQFRKILRWLILSLMVMFTLIVTMVYFILVKPSLSYYGSTTEGKILLMPGVKGGG